LIQNAKQLPAIWYGLHFAPGVAQYKEMDGEPIILINESTAKAMDKSFPGKPVYVHHVPDVNLPNLQNEADGYVVESFFNKSDGYHWCKFIAVSDAAHQAIQKGWVLSNAYEILENGPAGTWQGLEYQREVKRGEYEHLAIVPNPRYQQSIILSPADFKSYNEKKESELYKIANSKGESMLKLFKKTKVENAADIEGMSVTLPKSGKEVTLVKIINDFDEMEFNSGKPVMANGDHLVKVGDKDMSVNDLLEAYNSLTAKNETDPEDEEAKKKALELAEHEQKEIDEKKAQNEKEDEDKKEKEKVDNAAKKANYEKLKNAEAVAAAEKLKNSKVVEIIDDQVARGKARYGSKK
jgi:hypothetical protein